MHGLCMPTKTISIELDAYEKLAAAKKGPRDSFLEDDSARPLCEFRSNWSRFIETFG